MKNDHFGYPTRRSAIRILLAFLCVLSGNTFAQEFKTVHPGVEYARVEYRLGNDPVKIDLLRLDLSKVRLDVHHAMDAAIGVEKTSSIATRHGALAAINAGFFRLDTSIFAGDAQGVLSIDNALLSESVNGRVALMIDNNGPSTGVYIERANISHAIRIGKLELNVGTNRARKSDDVVIYTRYFGRTTLTDPNGTEFVVVNRRIKSIHNSGSTPIPDRGYVISASGKEREKLLAAAKVGAKVELTSRHSSTESALPGPGFGRSEDIVGGVPQLIKNGRIDITWEQEKASRSFAEMRHPRTAVAKLRDGRFLMMTVDGRQPGVSVGMTLAELAEYLFSLGATDAMNLDGGGSTTMFLDGKVVNTPSDKDGERKVSDAIIVTPRKTTR